MFRERFGRLMMIACFAVVGGMGVAGASAQDASPMPDPEMTTLAVNTVLCDDASCESWVTVDGATISALDADTNEVISTCDVSAVAAPEGCGLEVPTDDSQYLLSWDESLIPEGYVQAGDPFVVEFAPVHPNVLTLAFAPEAADDDDDAAATPVADDDSVTALPSTGTGDDGIGGGAMALAGLASLAVVALGAFGLNLRRR